MLGLQYQPRYGMVDHECWPSSKYVSIDIPDYKVTKPLDYYDSWPAYWYIYTPLRPFRTYLNNLLLRDLRTTQVCSYILVKTTNKSTQAPNDLTTQYE
ncbi:hypothetical protein D910_04523 [Dendroctonus ponderosae]|uniref:Uncharacterized protein n=1 Tax=Dendroctonus ponderosae TaxID=77166 RepID=U4U452_DENPD|nr:hypothetical protein D910_04523 [Dendroctonus ponderosae]